MNDTESMTTTKNVRTCRVCGRVAPIDQADRVASHRAGPTLPDVECGGTGYLPREVTR